MTIIRPADGRKHLVDKLRQLAARPGTAAEGQAAEAAVARVIQGSLFDQLPAPPLIGQQIKQARSCAYCGSQVFTVEPARGPHANHLRCAGCARGGRWMSHAQAEQLKAKAAS
jgi:hypothetical protein